LLFLLEIVRRELGTYCLCLCMSVDESIDEVSSSSDSDVLEPKTKMAKTEAAEINLAKVKGTIGSSNLKKFLSNRGLFIDKTLFIKEFMGCDFEVLALLLPRRFGKSLNLDILHSFLSLRGKSSIDFSGLKIGEDVDFVNEHLGKYPVIRLDLKDCEGETWNEMLKSIWKSLKLMLLDHKDLEETIIDTESFSVEDNVDYKFALKFLSAALYEKHGTEVIILIDEFDAPLNDAYRHGYYEEASKFFSAFYSAGLKGNHYLSKACLVGICQPSGRNLLSGLNNVRVFDVADNKFSEHFGFSFNEISHFFPPGTPVEIKEKVKFWYNGYRFGTNCKVLNPYSFMSYITEGEFKGYWTGTAVGVTFMPYLEPYLTSAMGSLLVLMDGGALEVPKLNHVINYETRQKPLSEVLHFLVLAGYLTYQANPETGGGIVSIPNMEVAVQWKTEFMQSFQNILAKEASLSAYFKKFQESITNFNKELLQESMQEFLLFVSSRDLQHRDSETTFHENVYHTFFLGAFLITFSTQAISNGEGGKGFFDIMIDLSGSKRAVIFEFKRSLSLEALTDDAKKAHKQIVDRKYFTKLSGYDVLLVGVSFFKKDMSKLVTSEIKTQLK
jgi:Predicted AAA-ATPase/PD-(D/E)XK nuclease superfamily